MPGARSSTCRFHISGPSRQPALWLSAWSSRRRPAWPILPFTSWPEIPTWSSSRAGAALMVGEVQAAPVIGTVGGAPVAIGGADAIGAVMAVRPDTGAVLGVTAATPPIMAVCPTAAGSPEPNLRQRVIVSRSSSGGAEHRPERVPKGPRNARPAGQVAPKSRHLG
jgi:hypothetical protein